MSLPLYERVALKRDLPEYGLRRGDVAVLIDHVPHPEGGEVGCVLEVFNSLGESIAVVAVRETEVEALRSDEVLAVRLLAGSVGSGPYLRTAHIRNFRSDRYFLREDLVVEIGEEEGQVVASSYDTDQYGCGTTAELAIEHLCAVLEDYYELLQEDRGRLSPRLESHLRYLDSILAPRPSPPAAL